MPLQTPETAALRRGGVAGAGINRGASGYLIERAEPPFHELLYTLEGTGQLTVGARATPAEPGSLLVLPARTVYRYEAVDVPWKIMWFHLNDLGPWLALGDGQPCVRQTSLLETLYRAVDGLRSESLAAASGSNRATSLFSELVVLYLEREVETSDTPRDRVLRQMLHDLWDTVNANLGAAWSVPELARKMNMSASGLHQAVVRLTGRTPKDTVRLLRMQRAEELLANYDCPLDEIADRVGYCSPFSFSTAFSRYKGMSPKMFRQRSRKA
ncbi:MAG: helix-turn-helix transcriptional regulator [Candidatus Hydrogenedentes bacterium]|nr:helix-turn-helix transcriptional regulator [Candidatus Hydrogenedentota bacterium]